MRKGQINVDSMLIRGPFLSGCKPYRVDMTKFMGMWTLPNMPKSKPIIQVTASHVNDCFCQIWKKNPFRIINVAQWVWQDGQYLSLFNEGMAKWPWRYRSRKKILHMTYLMPLIICTQYAGDIKRTLLQLRHIFFFKYDHSHIWSATWKATDVSAILCLTPLRSFVACLLAVFEESSQYLVWAAIGQGTSYRKDEGWPRTGFAYSDTVSENLELPQCQFFHHWGQCSLSW